MNSADVSPRNYYHETKVTTMDPDEIDAKAFPLFEAALSATSTSECEDEPTLSRNDTSKNKSVTLKLNNNALGISHLRLPT